mgnify:CR=1 FL=1
MSKYQTSPLPLETMPPGVPYIIGNEAAERFCFYGMRSILVIYMTTALLDRQGNLAAVSETTAKEWYHLFVAAMYFFPMVGAIIADALLGKYRTILSLSLVYCLGCFALALDQTRLGLFLGLSMIAIGAGGIKSCVSANVGDQFGPRNQHLLDRVFSWFYFSINFGSFFATLTMPILFDHFSRSDLYGPNAKHLGPAMAFGFPGLLMLTATFIFWLGRKKFVHVPPSGSGLLREAFSRDGAMVIAKLGTLFLFVAIYTSLYDQGASAWVLQAKKMDRQIFTWFQPTEEWLVAHGLTVLQGLSQFQIKPSHILAVNPMLIMVLIPFCTYLLYPAVGKFVELTPLRKLAGGFFLMAGAFLIAAYAATLIASSPTPPTVWWQLLAFVVLTMAEVTVNITCLQFCYTQAPAKMKSLVMGMYMLSWAGGNLFTAAVNYFISRPDGSSRLPGASYYWFFAGLMLITSLLFCIYAAFYREQNVAIRELDVAEEEAEAVS